MLTWGISTLQPYAWSEPSKQLQTAVQIHCHSNTTSNIKAILHLQGCKVLQVEWLQREFDISVLVSHNHTSGMVAGSLTFLS